MLFWAPVAEGSTTPLAKCSADAAAELSVPHDTESEVVDPHV